jgi:hypothetical protein
MIVLSILCAAVLVAVAIMAPSTQRPSHIEAVFPLTVRGHVWDTVGVPVAGADVEVSMKRPDTSVRSSYTTATNSTGAYSIAFAPAEWEVDDTIFVVAEFGADTVENSTIAEDCPIQYVNVTMTIAIPEFSDIGKIVSMAGILGIFMMVFFARRRKTA